MRLGTLSGAKEPISKLLDIATALGDGTIRLDARQTDLKISPSLSLRIPQGVTVTYKVHGTTVELQCEPAVLVTYAGMFSKHIKTAAVTVEKITVNLGMIMGEFDVDG